MNINSDDTEKDGKKKKKTQKSVQLYAILDSVIFCIQTNRTIQMWKLMSINK